MKPIKTGLAVALTLSLFYSLCTLFAVMFPETFLHFMNAFFHGLDFGKLTAAEPYAWSQFFYAVIVFAVWGFALGTFFAWLHSIFVPKGA